MSGDTNRWIGRQLTWPEVVVVLASSAFAIAIPASLAPVLLGALVAEKRLTLAELGQTATTELVALAVVCAIAGAFFRPTRIRLRAGIGGAGLVAANALTMASSHGWVLLVRGLSGACYGLYLWILVCMLVRSRNAARYNAFVATGQSVLSILLAFAFTALLIPRLGINGGYASLAVLSAVTAVASGLFPAAFDALPGVRVQRVPPLEGIAGLVVVFLYLAGVIGIWAYIGAMSEQSGHTAQQTSTAVSIALGAQVLGAFSASLLGNRIRPIIALTVAGLGSCALAVAIKSEIPIVEFQIALGLFGFLWMFATSFLIPLTLDIDPTGASAMYSVTVQGFGAAAGPALGAFFLVGSDVRNAILVGACLLVLAVALAITAQRMAAPRSAPTLT
jgi:MFS transporter, DHA1 family, inner membrane transport protein